MIGSATSSAASAKTARQAPGAGGGCPAALGNRRDLPGAVRQRHPRRHRLLVEHRRIAVERRGRLAPSAPRQHHVDAEIGRRPARPPRRAGRIDHRRDDPPEPPLPPGSGVDEDRRARQEASAPWTSSIGPATTVTPRSRASSALGELIRMVAHSRGRAPPRCPARDGPAGRPGRARRRSAHLVAPAQHLRSERVEPPLVHAGLEAHHRHQPLHELDVAVDDALQAGREQVDLVLHLARRIPRATPRGARARTAARACTTIASGSAAAPSQASRNMDRPAASTFSIRRPVFAAMAAELYRRSRLINCE